VITIEPRIVLV